MFGFKLQQKDKRDSYCCGVAYFCTFFIPYRMYSQLCLSDTVLAQPVETGGTVESAVFMDRHTSVRLPCRVRGRYAKHFSCRITTEDLFLKYITGSKDSRSTLQNNILQNARGATSNAMQESLYKWCLNSSSFTFKHPNVARNCFTISCLLCLLFRKSPLSWSLKTFWENRKSIKASQQTCWKPWPLTSALNMKFMLRQITSTGVLRMTGRGTD